IEHDPAGRREGFDQRLDNADGLSVGCATLPVYSQGCTSLSRRAGFFRPPLTQDLRRLVRHSDEAAAGRIGLRPHDMTNSTESRFRPGVNERIQFRITIESNTEGVRFEDAVKLGTDTGVDTRLVIIGESGPFGPCSAQDKADR